MKRPGHALLLLLALVMVVGCSGPAPVSIRCAGDLLSLGKRAAAEPIPGLQEKPVVELSTHSLQDLKGGRCQVVLLGREPTSEELQGLQDHVIAYDAICFLVDRVSHRGGMWPRGVGKVIRFAGLRDLSLADLQGMFSNRLRKPGEPLWVWHGPNEEYGCLTDPSTGEVVPDPEEPGECLLGWYAAPLTLTCSISYPPGKFDTQRALFDRLGLDEAAMVRAAAKETFPEYAAEEEMLVGLYTGILDERYAPLRLLLSYASRRVAARAPRYLDVEVVTVGGIDPLQNTAAIYEGSYPLSRRIHLLTRQDPSPEAQAIAAFFLSQEGQDVVRRAGYLRLP
ncbi:MAG: hypothetical protein ACUVX9_09470 [Anaerolineae bacterium]